LRFALVEALYRHLLMHLCLCDGDCFKQSPYYWAFPIAGVVDVVDYVKKSESRWYFRGSWDWVIANLRRLLFRKSKGALGFFRLKRYHLTFGAHFQIRPPSWPVSRMGD
jgi:hypothetical protein